jgi:hypothetical protein
VIGIQRERRRRAKTPSLKSGKIKGEKVTRKERKGKKKEKTVSQRRIIREHKGARNKEIPRSTL